MTHWKTLTRQSNVEPRLRPKRISGFLCLEKIHGVSGSPEAALKESRGGRTGRSRGVESSKKQRNFQGRKGELAGSNRVSSSPWSHAIAAINETERVGRERQTDTTRLRRNEARFCVNTEID
jgi:hypothetical protein